MVVYVGNPKESIKELFELINDFSKATGNKVINISAIKY